MKCPGNLGRKSTQKKQRGASTGTNKGREGGLSVWVLYQSERKGGGARQFPFTSKRKKKKGRKVPTWNEMAGKGKKRGGYAGTTSTLRELCTEKKPPLSLQGGKPIFKGEEKEIVYRPKKKKGGPRSK